MSRGKKWGVAGTLFVAAVVAGLCLWLLLRLDPETASRCAGLIQTFVAVFSVSGIVFAVMAMVSSSGAGENVQNNHAGPGGSVFAAQGGSVHVGGRAPGRVEGGDGKEVAGGQNV